MDAAGGHLGGWCHRPLRREANDSNGESRGPEGSLRASSVVRTPCILIYLALPRSLWDLSFPDQGEKPGPRQ